jgi:hydroxymethylglutaryl-CoA lyase
MKSNFSTVSVVEVGPRDGLQNEPIKVDLQLKLSLIDALARSGIQRIEAGAFVHPAKVPQMADSDLLFQQLIKLPGVRYSALVPNLKGLDRAASLPVDEIGVFASASEEFSQRNLNASIAESMQQFQKVIETSLAKGLPIRGYISCALGCPFAGEVPPENVAPIADELLRMGCYEVCLADTIGTGTTKKMELLLQTCMGQSLPASKLAVHLHDTYGQALANCKVALDMGIRTFDAAVAGLGGCPFAPGATGNLATEDLVYMLEGAGFSTGIDLDMLAKVGEKISLDLNRNNSSRTGSALSRKT